MRYIGVIIKSVICMLAIVGAVALYISNPFGPSDQARISAVRSDLIQIQVALKLYCIDNGNFPTEEQGLYALVESKRLMNPLLH
jgi:general secretion pathway protein G